MDQEIEKMPYVDFIALLDETNRCPGGKHTIRKILQNSFTNAQSNVLEIGSNTGFSSLEVARTARCRVLGIDPSISAVAQSNKVLSTDTAEIRSKVTFQVGSAYDIPSEDNNFDLIIAGGATSFMKDKDKAVSEYHRVLKPWGFLSVANLYYKSPPPAHVTDAVSNVIGTKIEPWDKKKWKSVLSMNDVFETYWEEDGDVHTRSEGEIASYVDYFLKKPHLAQLSAAKKEAVKVRWYETLKIFNENLKYAGYQMALYRKAYMEEEPELFPYKGKS